MHVCLYDCMYIIPSMWNLKCILSVILQLADIDIEPVCKAPVLPKCGVQYLQSGIKWGKFQDGFPNLFIEEVKKVAGRDGEFVQLTFCFKKYFH